MKKITALLLSIILITSAFSIQSFALTKDFKGTGIDLISDGETWRESWNTKTKLVYLTVNNTGFYDLKINDYKGNANLDLSIYENQSPNSYDADSFYNTYYGSSSYSEYNIYLIKGKIYTVELAYYYWDDTVGADLYPLSDIAIKFTKNNYTAEELTSSLTEISLSNYKNSFFVFKSSTAGDYQLSLNSAITGTDICVYKKSTGTYLDGFSADNNSSVKFKFAANTEYLIEITKVKSGTLNYASVKKCTKNVKSVTFNGTPAIYQDDYFCASDYDYKVTYSDNSTDVLSFDEINFSLSAYYAGAYTGDYYSPGLQTVKIVYFSDGISYPKINIINVIDGIPDAKPIKEYSECVFTNDGEEHEVGYYKIKVSNNNLYAFYSYDWDDIGDYYLDIFDANGKIVKQDSNGCWKLVGGKMYCFRFEVYFADDYYYDFYFSLEPYKEHKHTYKTTTTAATYFSAGKKVTKCSVCGYTVTKSIPKKVLKKPTAKLTAAKKALKIKVNKVTGQTGFQIRYRIKGKSKWTVKTYTGKKTVTKTIKLKAKKNYQVQVRAMVKKGSKKAYSSWSKTYQKKTK